MGGSRVQSRIAAAIVQKTINDAASAGRIITDNVVTGDATDFSAASCCPRRVQDSVVILGLRACRCSQQNNGSGTNRSPKRMQCLNVWCFCVHWTSDVKFLKHNRLVAEYYELKCVMSRMIYSQPQQPFEVVAVKLESGNPQAVFSFQRQPYPLLSRDDVEPEEGPVFFAQIMVIFRANKGDA